MTMVMIHLVVKFTSVAVKTIEIVAAAFFDSFPWLSVLSLVLEMADIATVMVAMAAAMVVVVVFMDLAVKTIEMVAVAFSSVLSLVAEMADIAAATVVVVVFMDLTAAGDESEMSAACEISGSMKITNNGSMDQTPTQQVSLSHAFVAFLPTLQTLCN